MRLLCHLWVIAFKKLKEQLDETTLPLIASLSALSFIIMMFNIPIPGGTSGHAVGASLIAILFGPWVASLCVSLVLSDSSTCFWRWWCDNVWCQCPFNGIYLLFLFLLSLSNLQNRNRLHRMSAVGLALCVLRWF